MTSIVHDPILPVAAEILDSRELSVDTTLYRLRIPGGWDAFRFIPGQFVQLSVPSVGEAPISLAGGPTVDNTVDLCVRRVGRVTEMLHRLHRGGVAGIRGPFGNGFPLVEWRGRNIILLAGGLGIAPLRSLLYHLLDRREEFGEITMMYGAREPSSILFKEELAQFGSRSDMHLFLTVDFATEEPPAGVVCNTGLLPSLLKGTRFDTRNAVAAVCGPPALYRCVIDELQGLGIAGDDIFLSLERRMKCGSGFCCHCAVGDLFCCTDGPVFRYSQLERISGAL